MGPELFIDGKKCDLPPGLIIAMSYSANFIAEAIAPAGSASNEFSLPKTRPNIVIFEGADLVTSDTDIPYRKLPARLIQNGRELIPDGFAIMEESARFYKIVVYGGNLEFFELIKNKKLRELDLSDFDHIWSFANVAASRGFTEGYIYPIIDWSDDGAFIDNVSNKIDPRTMYHAIFNKTIIDRIFSEVSFSKSGDILDDPGYQNLIIPIVDSIQSDALKEDRVVERKIAGGGTPTAQISTGQQGSDAVFVNPLKMNGFIKDVYGFMTVQTVTAIGFTLTNTLVYEAPVTGQYSVQFFGEHSQTDNVFFSVSLQLWRIKPSGARVIVFSDGVTISQVPFNYDGTFKMDEGDKLTPVIVSGGTFPNTQFPKAFIINPFITITPLTPKNVYNTLISAGDNLPDMTQTDYIKSIAKVFGIIFQTNSFSKVVEFRQFKDIYKNLYKAKDWTDKLDRNESNKVTTISYHPDGYAQTNVFKWSNETSQTLAEELGEGSIIVNDETLEDKKTLIEIPFSATEMDKRMLDLDLPIIRFLKLGLPKGAVKPRMLILEKSSTVQIEYNDTVVSGTVGNNIPLCYFQLAGKSFNLGFDDSLIDDNYKEFDFFLDRFKQVNAWFNLDENDIAELDFFIPVYIDHFKHYFFISNVENFVAGQSTKVELVRL